MFYDFTDIYTYHVNGNNALENQSVHYIGSKRKPYITNVCKRYQADLAREQERRLTMARAVQIPKYGQMTTAGRAE